MNDVHCILENKKKKNMSWRISPIASLGRNFLFYEIFQFVPMVCNDYWGDAFTIISYVTKIFYDIK